MTLPRFLLLSVPPLALVAGLLAAKQASRPQAAEAAASLLFSTEVMSTRFDLRLPDREGAEEAASAAFAVFAEVDLAMNEWRPESPLSAVNREAGAAAVVVPADLLDLVERGIEIGRLTGGAFDVTWAALWGVWDFKADRPAVPDPALVARAAALVDFREVRVDREAGTLMLARPGMAIGLGGIAKGWALDRAAALLRERGFRDFLLQGGGQVYAAGTRADGSPWRVGIRDPRGPADDFFAIAPVSDVSLSTSGDYERFFFADGVRFHHILDPRTGMPARGIRSATAVHADATLADAMSTALVVLGPERGMALVQAVPGLDAVLVDSDGRVLASPAIDGRLIRVHAPAGPGLP